METTYQGISGTVYIVEENHIAKGGEGSIHDIKNDSRFVAKIFKPEKRSVEREQKLRIMVQARLTEVQLQQVTWPQDVIYDKSGFVGYIMPKLADSSPINSIYSDGFDNKYDLRFRLLAAVNLCYALQTVHEMGQVCGDLNPQNICINLNMNNSGTAFHITLVDTDSYHISAGGKTYRCEVGLGEYIAPELQKKMSGEINLRNAPLPTYTKETDLFALAVHIFTLLMNGCHPFACAMDQYGTDFTMPQMTESFVKDSVAIPQPIDNIKKGFFPFYEKREGIMHPIYAPSFDALPERLQRLFIRTFVNGYEDPQQRADTQEWIEALYAVKDSIVSCEATGEKEGLGKHYFFGHSPVCSLCEVEERMRGVFPPPPPPPKPEKKKKKKKRKKKKKHLPPPPPPAQCRWVKIWGILQFMCITIICCEEWLRLDSVRHVNGGLFYEVLFFLSMRSLYLLIVVGNKRKGHIITLVLWGMVLSGLVLSGVVFRVFDSIHNDLIIPLREQQYDVGGAISNWLHLTTLQNVIGLLVLLSSIGTMIAHMCVLKKCGKP